MSNEHSEEAPGHNKSYSIIVNGRPREVTNRELTYLQVVQLAFPGEQPSEGVIYTVTYSNPHGNDGSLVEGESVKIKDGIIFNVDRTDKS